MTVPRVTLVSNQAGPAGSPGMTDGLRLLEKAGSIQVAEEVYLNLALPAPDRERLALAALASATGDILFVHSPAGLLRDRRGLRAAISGRPVVFWEGDAWGRRKTLPAAYRVWLQNATHVFSCAGPPQSDGLQSMSPVPVQPIISTYDHVVFAKLEQWDASPPVSEVSMVGNNLARVPGLTGLPGSANRWRLARSLHRRFRGDFALAGDGWPRGWSVGPITYSEQGGYTRRARISAAWDHFPEHRAYTSDRTCIGLLAGRPRVLSASPGLERWLPGADFGVFPATTPGIAVERIGELAELSTSQLLPMGRAAHEWARGRVSHRQAVAYMLSEALETVEPPEMPPWPTLRSVWNP